MFNASAQSAIGLPKTHDGSHTSEVIAAVVKKQGQGKLHETADGYEETPLLKAQCTAKDFSQAQMPSESDKNKVPPSGFRGGCGKRQFLEPLVTNGQCCHLSNQGVKQVNCSHV